MAIPDKKARTVAQTQPPGRRQGNGAGYPRSVWFRAVFFQEPSFCVATGKEIFVNHLPDPRS